MWLGKLSADGSRLIFGTYVGKGYIACHNIALDADANIFVTAFQSGPGPWPITPGAFQPKYGGGTHCMAIAKFSPSGALLAGTYLGGSGGEFDGPDDMAVDASGNLLIGCQSTSTDYPVTDGALRLKKRGRQPCRVFDLVERSCARCSIRPITAITAAQIRHSVK